MQKLISKYGLATHLALLAVFPVFLPPFWSLWLALVVAAWILMEPSRVGREMLHDARRRVASACVCDPLFWFSMVLVVFTAVRWANGGIAMAYDAETVQWSLSPPQMPLMPGSADGRGGPEFASAVAWAVVVQGCRHALGKSARMAFLLLVSVFVGIATFVLGVLLASGSPILHELVSCPVTVPVYLGAAFGFALIAGTVALLAVFERQWRMAIPFSAIGIAGCAFGLFAFSPCWMLAAFVAAEVLVLLYAFVYARRQLPSSGEFKLMVVFGMSMVLAWVFATTTLSDKERADKVSPFVTRTIFTTEYRNIRSSLSALSSRVWKAHPWLGTGLGTMPLDIRFYAAEADWPVIPPEQNAAVNGYWQFLAERGIVGAFFVLSALGFLLWTYFRRLVRGVLCHTLPHPASWAGFLALLAFAATTAADSSFAYPGILGLGAAILAISAGSFPKEKRDV